MLQRSKGQGRVFPLNWSFEISFVKEVERRSCSFRCFLWSVHYYLPFIQTLIVKSSVAMGVMLAALIYFYKNNLPKNLAHNLDPLYSISLNKWYVDELYNSIFIKPYFLLANLFWKRGDEKIIDRYGPNGISKIVGMTANYLSRFQSGYLYHYAFAMLGGLVIILTWFIYY